MRCPSARNLANEPGLVSNTIVDQYINLANRELFEDIVKTDANWYERKIEIALSTGDFRITGIANQFNSKRIMDIWYEPANSSGTSFRRLVFRPKIEFGFPPEETDALTNTGPIWYSVSHDDIILVPPAGESGTLHLRYIRPWVPTAIGTIDSFPSSTQITMNIATVSSGEVHTRQNVFSGGVVRLLDNTAYHGQEFNCTATTVTPTQYILTVSPAIPAAIAPFGRAYVLPSVPEEYHESLAQYAAHTLYLMQRNVGMSNTFNGLYEANREKLIQAISGRRRDGPDGIVYIYDPFDKPLVPW